MLTLPDKPLLQLFWSRVMQHLTLWMSLLRRIDVTNSYYYSSSRKFGSLFLAGENTRAVFMGIDASAHGIFILQKTAQHNKQLHNRSYLPQTNSIQILLWREKKKEKKQVLILPITEGFSATSSNTNAIMTWLEIPVQIEVWQEGRIQSDEEKRERDRDLEKTETGWWLLLTGL